METKIPEKARLLDLLKQGGFNVPPFVYLPAEDFRKEDFTRLTEFLEEHNESFKVLARSAHPHEEFYKGGTFDSLETYADVGGIKYARKKIIQLGATAKKLSILRQQKFHGAPGFDPEEMGVIVMPFVSGSSVMAKKVKNTWEFGYLPDHRHKVQSEPYITETPHDTRLLDLSREIEGYLGFRCEIEYIMVPDGDIWVVQAKDISSVESAEFTEDERCVKLDGVRRIRKRRNFRERSVYVMNNREFYINVVGMCEDIVNGCEGDTPTIDDLLEFVESYERDMRDFALKHQRYAVLGLSIHDQDELYQIVNNYLGEFPELQKRLSRALHDNLYHVDYFLAEADTLITKDSFRMNLCTHEAYGIDTIRNPLWTVFWTRDRHEAVVREFRRLNVKTGDHLHIDIDASGRPTVCLM
ncbi:MAG: hypothetical protein ACLFOY_16345 [Desulfatibacillaceae bacterium]